MIFVHIISIGQCDGSCVYTCTSCRYSSAYYALLHVLPVSIYIYMYVHIWECIY